MESRPLWTHQALSRLRSFGTSSASGIGNTSLDAGSSQQDLAFGTFALLNSSHFRFSDRRSASVDRRGPLSDFRFGIGFHLRYQPLL